MRNNCEKWAGDVRKMYAVSYKIGKKEKKEAKKSKEFIYNTKEKRKVAQNTKIHGLPLFVHLI